MNACPEQENYMNCIPEKENLLLAYRDKFTSIQQTHPEWSATDIRFQTAADLRPQFRLNREAGDRENLGLSEYDVPEAAFTLTEDGSILYTKYGQGLIELHERQLRLMPDTYSPEEHAISRLIEEHFRQGATTVVTSYGDRDVVIMQFDPIARIGTTKIIDATKQQLTIQDVAKKRFAHLESLHLTDKIFLFADKKLSMQRAIEVIEPIIKQQVRTKPKFNGVSEIKHIEPQFYKRLFAFTEDSFIREEQIPLAKNKPFIHLPLTPVIYWDTSVRPWIVPDEIPIQKQHVIKESIKFFETSHYKVRTEPTQIVQEMILPNDQQKNVPQDIPMIIFQASPKPTKEPEPIIKQQEVKPDFVLPIATIVTMIDTQAIPIYHEKVITISFAAIKQNYIKQTVRENMPIAEYVPIPVQPKIQEEKHVQEEQEMRETDAIFEVDQVSIQGINELTKTLGKQIMRGESPLCTVKKILWMESNDQDKLVPVEEVEIAQDATRTTHNLLHFLRKVVRKYCGEDSIRQRVIQQIASDKWDDEVGEIEEYLTFLKRQRLHGHLFAVVN